ncbi:hypothetical protein ACI77N_13110 [Pseudomonas sp. S191]|uniref:hypothetical protein n=1 Tax=Pseudomonas sp. S191 TaxID=579575 RepID=UPI00387B2D70
MDIRDKQPISSWMMDVYDDRVSFTRVGKDGRVVEGYPPVSTAKAVVYAAAIVSGLQPPRDLRPCDTQID